jgi:hypothetical protein
MNDHRNLLGTLIRRGLVIASFILAGSASVSADTVVVPNASFEAGGLVGWTYSNPDILSDWTFNAPTGSGYDSLWLVFFNSPGTSSDSECAFI